VQTLRQVKPSHFWQWAEERIGIRNTVSLDTDLPGAVPAGSFEKEPTATQFTSQPTNRHAASRARSDGYSRLDPP